MRVSRYNKFFHAEDGTILAYNCLSGGLATLTAQRYPLVKEILLSPNTYRFDTKEEQDLRDNLLRGGFLIEDQIDEMSVLKVRHRTARFDQSSFTLTILPTLNCNFQCIYCYEAKKNISMSKEIQKALVEYVRKKTEKVKNFNVSWYGGEPLLVLDTITNLHGEFDKICKTNDCRYNQGGIITNGYLMTTSVAKQLKEMGIKTVQVTVDGPKEVHNQRRPLSNGKGTFDRIMKNLREVADILETVTIRVNIDSMNADRAIEVLDVIEEHGLKGKVGVYFAQVHVHTEVCANIADSCLMNQEYSMLEVELMKQSMDKGFIITRYPRVKFNYCGADHINSFVVDPNGYLYKCWSDPGNFDEVVGHISDSEKNRVQSKNQFKWLSWDVFDRKECRQCEVLPICMGGCPYLGLKLKTKRRGACEHSRYNLLDMLKLYYTRYCRTSIEVSKNE